MGVARCDLFHVRRFVVRGLVGLGLDVSFDSSQIGMVIGWLYWTGGFIFDRE